jgi:xanthine phosphoribosyltransferase
MYHCSNLVTTLKPPTRGIIAVARGGLTPALLLAQVWDVRLVETVCVKSYEGQASRGLQILRSPSEIAQHDLGHGWLVVDDLVDTGATFRSIRAMLPWAVFTCMFAKPKGSAQVETYSEAVSQDTWLKFPWEFDEVSIPSPIKD